MNNFILTLPSVHTNHIEEAKWKNFSVFILFLSLSPLLSYNFISNNILVCKILIRLYENCILIWEIFVNDFNNIHEQIYAIKMQKMMITQ